MTKSFYDIYRLFRDIYNLIRNRHQFAVYITTTITEKDGKITKQRERTETFLFGYMAALLNHMWDLVVVVGVRTETGGVIDLGGTSDGLQIESSDVLNVRGLVVGTGVTDVALSDYTLAAKIGHGNGVGQLLHSGTIVTGAWRDANKAAFKVWRTFANGSPSSIAIREIGLIGDDPPRSILLDRTLKTRIIPPGASALIELEIAVIV